MPRIHAFSRRRLRRSGSLPRRQGLLWNRLQAQSQDFPRSAAHAIAPQRQRSTSSLLPVTRAVRDATSCGPCVRVRGGQAFRRAVRRLHEPLRWLPFAHVTAGGGSHRRRPKGRSAFSRGAGRRARIRAAEGNGPAAPLAGFMTGGSSDEGVTYVIGLTEPVSVGVSCDHAGQRHMRRGRRPRLWPRIIVPAKGFPMVLLGA